MRLTLKVCPRGRRLIRADIEVDAEPTDEDLRQAAVAAAQVLTRRKAHRLGSAAREDKSEAIAPPHFSPPNHVDD